MGQSFSSSSRGIKLRCQQPWSERMKLYSLLFLFGFISASPLPQDEDMPPMPYQFTNRVSEDNPELDEEDRGIYWTQDEGAPEDNPGRVEGEYSVWLADGRLMTVSYYVDGESGFVPTITYTDGYTPEFDN